MASRIEFFQVLRGFRCKHLIETWSVNLPMIRRVLSQAWQATAAARVRVARNIAKSVRPWPTARTCPQHCCTTSQKYATMKVARAHIRLFGIFKFAASVLTGRRLGVGVTKPAKSIIAQLISGYVALLATDLEAFAHHGKRSTVSTDDVRLCARRNPSLVRAWAAVHACGFRAGVTLCVPEPDTDVGRRYGP